MNDTERSELELLKQRQESVSHQLAFLAKEIEALKLRLTTQSAEAERQAEEAQQTAEQPISPIATTASNAPGVIAQTSAAEKLSATRQPLRQAKAAGGALPPIIPAPAATVETPLGHSAGTAKDLAGAA